MKIGLCWLVEVSWVSLVPPLDSGFRRTDECGAGGIQALSRLRRRIFVPMTRVGSILVPMPRIRSVPLGLSSYLKTVGRPASANHDVYRPLDHAIAGQRSVFLAHDCDIEPVGASVAGLK